VFEKNEFMNSDVLFLLDGPELVWVIRTGKKGVC